MLKARQLSENGYPNVQIYDQKYRPRFLLSLDEEHQKILLSMKGVDGKGRIVLEVDRANSHDIKTLASGDGQAETGQLGPNQVR